MILYIAIVIFTLSNVVGFCYWLAFQLGYFPLDGLYVIFVYWLKVECTLQVKDASPNDEGYYQKLRGHLLLASSMVCGPSCMIPVYAM